MTLIAYVFLKLSTAKEVLRQMSKKPCFRTPFDSKKPKRSGIHLKSEQNNFFHIFHHSEQNGIVKSL